MDILTDTVWGLPLLLIGCAMVLFPLVLRCINRFEEDRENRCPCQEEIISQGSNTWDDEYSDEESDERPAFNRFFCESHTPLDCIKTPRNSEAIWRLLKEEQLLSCCASRRDYGSFTTPPPTTPIHESRQPPHQTAPDIDPNQPTTYEARWKAQLTNLADHRSYVLPTTGVYHDRENPGTLVLTDVCQWEEVDACPETFKW